MARRSLKFKQEQYFEREQAKGAKSTLVLISNVFKKQTAAEYSDSLLREAPAKRTDKQLIDLSEDGELPVGRFFFILDEEKAG